MSYSFFNKYVRDKNKSIRLYPVQMGTQTFGKLQVRCVTPNMAPIEGATISISSPSQPTVILEELTTNVSGLTPQIELPAPPIDYSLEPSEVQPYAEYNIRAMQPDYTPVSVANIQLLAQVTAIQRCYYGAGTGTGYRRFFICYPAPYPIWRFSS